MRRPKEGTAALQAYVRVWVHARGRVLVREVIRLFPWSRHRYCVYFAVAPGLSLIDVVIVELEGSVVGRGVFVRDGGYIVFIVGEVVCVWVRFNLGAIGEDFAFREADYVVDEAEECRVSAADYWRGGERAGEDLLVGGRGGRD